MKKHNRGKIFISVVKLFINFEIFYYHHVKIKFGQNLELIPSIIVMIKVILKNIHIPSPIITTVVDLEIQNGLKQFLNYKILFGVLEIVLQQE